MAWGGVGGTTAAGGAGGSGGSPAQVLLCKTWAGLISVFSAAGRMPSGLITGAGGVEAGTGLMGLVIGGGGGLVSNLSVSGLSTRGDGLTAVGGRGGDGRGVMINGSSFVGAGRASRVVGSGVGGGGLGAVSWGEGGGGSGVGGWGMDGRTALGGGVGLNCGGGAGGAALGMPFFIFLALISSSHRWPCIFLSDSRSGERIC